jgi:AcrR family transcriptional regulator
VPKDAVTGVRRERADAARNRAKILAAAAEIVTTRGVEALSMADVAAAAGVGGGRSTGGSAIGRAWHTR